MWVGGALCPLLCPLLRIQGSKLVPGWGDYTCSASTSLHLSLGIPGLRPAAEIKPYSSDTALSAHPAGPAPEKTVEGTPLLTANVAAPACLPSLFFTESLGLMGKWPLQPAGGRDTHVPGEQPILGSLPSRDPCRLLLAPFSPCSHPGLQSETTALGNMKLTGPSQGPFCLPFTLYHLPHEDSFQTEQFRKSLCGQNCSPTSFQMLAGPGHYCPGSRLCCYLGYDPSPPFPFLLPPPHSQGQPAFSHTHTPKHLS